MQFDRSMFEAALIGLTVQRQQIEEQISSIRSQLGGRSTPSATPAVEGEPKAKRQMSAAAKKRIRDAQKKRWAAFHAQHGKPAAKKTTSKRTMSPERRAALIANLKKARAARAAKRSAA